MYRGNKYFPLSIFLALFVILSLPVTILLTQPEDCSGAAATLYLSIVEPTEGQTINYCTNFDVTAELSTPDTVSNVTARIEISGNAELQSGSVIQSGGTL